MPPKKRTQSQSSRKTPTTPKKTPKSRGRHAKNTKNVQSEGADSSSERELTALATKDIVPSVVQSCYPSENVLLASVIEGTTKSVEEAVLNVIDDAALQCTVPIDKMASMCKKLRTMIIDRNLEGVPGNSPILEATLDEAFAEMSEDGVNIDERVFRQELIKYTLIASSQFDKLSTGTMLSIVDDLHARGLNMTEYEAGCPARVSSTIEQFYSLTAYEFASLNEHQQLKFKKEYVREKLVTCKEFSEYLDDSYKKLLVERGNGDADNPFKDSPEGRAKLDEIIQSFKKNREMERSLKTEYERLTTKEDVLLGSYKEKYRTKMLHGIIGPQSEEFEEELERNFANCPFDTLKEMIDGENINNENLEVRTAKVPSMKNNKACVEYKHPFIPTPSVHLVHDPF